MGCVTIAVILKMLILIYSKTKIIKLRKSPLAWTMHINFKNIRYMKFTYITNGKYNLRNTNCTPKTFIDQFNIPYNCSKCISKPDNARFVVIFPEATGSYYVAVSHRSGFNIHATNRCYLHEGRGESKSSLIITLLFRRGAWSIVIIVKPCVTNVCLRGTNAGIRYVC